MNPITKMMSETLTKLLAEGWLPPLCFATISVNGSFLCGRYDANDQGGFETTLVAEHIEGEDYALPINILVTNVQGDAIRLMLLHPDGPITSN